MPPNKDGSAEQAIVVCQTCQDQINAPATMDTNHWRCLNDAIWKPTQAMSWRLLKHLQSEGWANDLLDMTYLEDEVQQWVQAMLSSGEKHFINKIIHNKLKAELMVLALFY